MLTEKQKELLLLIHARLQETGVPPSFDEMKDALDLKSKSGIHRLITALEERGFIGGGHIGYNWQAGQMVLGVEADFNASGIEATRSQTIGGIAVSTSHGHDWLASIRARAGVTVSSAMLLYLTAGVAFTNAELAGSATDGITTIGVSSSTSASGWVVGGGAEVKLGGNWSGRLEGLHYGFDESFDFGGTTIRNDEVGVTVIRGGISYHFN